jgi:ankyrin repeat protein
LSDVRLARLLIWLGAKLNPENPHWTPLLATCAKGNSALVKLLIEREADVNLPGYSKWTPLMVAVQEGHEDVVEILLRAGADVDATNEQGLRAKDYSNSERILQMLDSALPRS